jgi:nucleotide-binding universal stress UspA family protein
MTEASGQRPVILAYDGSPQARRAIEQAAILLLPINALVVTVWEPQLPAVAMASEPFPGGTAVYPFDLGQATALDQAMYERAAAIAEDGAVLARANRFEAEALVVPDEQHVAETIARIAAERKAHDRGRVARPVGSAVAPTRQHR